jgi:hypothetical protein
LKIIEQGKSDRKHPQYRYIKANWPDNQWLYARMKMNTILFHSLFNDLDLTTLKHCIFYFDSIEIPTISVPITWGKKNQNVRYLQSIPENVYDVIDFLKDEGVVNLVAVKDVPDRKLPEVYDLILKEIDSIGVDRHYSTGDIKEICNFIDIKPDDPERLKIVDQISIFLASVCIMSLSLNEQVCCIDNKLVFDSLNLGIKRIINSKFQPNDIGTFEINKLKSNILAQKVIALNLPSFKFHTFEDVLGA